MKETSVRFLDQKGEERTLFLPVKDKKKLLRFMRILFAEDNFAYTLLGSKPVSWATYKKPFPITDLSRLYDTFKTYHRSLRSGWEIWSKYRHLFPSTTFWAENSIRHPGWVSILLVNREQFNRVVNENICDFHAILHREIASGFQLLAEATDLSLIDEILQGHQALIGIVLGYGRNNSWKFLEGSKKRQPLSCIWDESHLQREEKIQTRTEAIDIEGYLSQSCPSFAGDPFSKESLTLKEDYLLTKQKVINYYKGKDFLEATLSLLAGFHPDS